MKDALAAHAASLGFDLCAVAKCSPPPHAGQFLEWIDQGRAGEMTWLARNKARRTDPQQVLPGARSIIVLAMNYWQGGTGKKAGRTAGLRAMRGAMTTTR